MAIPDLCCVFWINSWVTFVSYCSAKPGVRGWPLLDPNSILSVPQIPFVLDHKGENAMHSLEKPCSASPVPDPTLCMQNLLLGVLNVCAASSSQGLDLARGV